MSFKIKINDGFCEYEYELPISEDFSIEDVINKIYKAFNLKQKPDGKYIKPCKQ